MTELPEIPERKQIEVHTEYVVEYKYVHEDQRLPEMPLWLELSGGHESEQRAKDLKINAEVMDEALGMTNTHPKEYRVVRITTTYEKEVLD